MNQDERHVLVCVYMRNPVQSQQHAPSCSHLRSNQRPVRVLAPMTSDINVLDSWLPKSSILPQILFIKSLIVVDLIANNTGEMRNAQHSHDLDQSATPSGPAHQHKLEIYRMRSMSFLPHIPGSTQECNEKREKKEIETSSRVGSKNCDQKVPKDQQS